MTSTDVHFVRTELAPVLPPPAATGGLVGWMRANLFSSVGNVLLTAIGILILWSLFAPLINFALFDAVWTGDGRAACLGHEGACWPYVADYFPQFIYGRYPLEERWRVDIVFAAFALSLVPMLIPSAPFKRANVIIMLIVFPVVSFFLLVGFRLPGGFGLAIVETPNWGGLLVTLVIAVSGIAASLPIGIVLALGRRSRMPVVRLVSVIFIEFWRGVPLITVLFMSSVVLPLFLPEGVSFDKLLRALIGVALFASAYMAEVVRGGLQAIPAGQYEGAMALGLRYWQSMGLVIMPQALKMVIPGIVNTFIGLFKDTSLVLIIGLFDLLGQIQSSFTDPTWATPTQSHTGYLFAAAIYWTFCFSMSRYSIFMEKRLHTGHER